MVVLSPPLLISVGISAFYLLCGIPIWWLVYAIRHHASLRGNGIKLFLISHAFVLLYSIFRVIAPWASMPCAPLDWVYATTKFVFVWLHTLRYLRIFAYHVVGMTLTDRLVSENNLTNRASQYRMSEANIYSAPFRRQSSRLQRRLKRCRALSSYLMNPDSRLHHARICRFLLGRNFLIIWNAFGIIVFQSVLIALQVHQAEPLSDIYPSCVSIINLNDLIILPVVYVTRVMSWLWVGTFTILIAMFSFAQIEDRYYINIKLRCIGAFYILSSIIVACVRGYIASSYVTTIMSGSMALTFLLDLLTSSCSEIMACTPAWNNYGSRSLSAPSRLTKAIQESHVSLFSQLEHTPERMNLLFSTDSELAMFYDYARQRYCYENLAFLIEVHALRSEQGCQSFSGDLSTFKPAALATPEEAATIRSIHHRYIAPFSPQEININADLRSSIGQQLSEASSLTSIYDSTFAEIYNLCFIDTFRRFLDEVKVWMSEHRPSMNGHRDSLLRISRHVTDKKKAKGAEMTEVVSPRSEVVILSSAVDT